MCQQVRPQAQLDRILIIPPVVLRAVWATLLTINLIGGMVTYPVGVMEQEVTAIQIPVVSRYAPVQDVRHILILFQIGQVGRQFQYPVQPVQKRYQFHINLQVHQQAW